MTALPAVERPDGRLYRPRYLVADVVTDEDEFVTGIVVFGTHNPSRAQALADKHAGWHAPDGGMVAADPERVWWRDGFESGRRRWIADEVKGRAAVWFRSFAERSVAP